MTKKLMHRKNSCTTSIIEITLHVFIFRSTKPKYRKMVKLGADVNPNPTTIFALHRTDSFKNS